MSAFYLFIYFLLLNTYNVKLKPDITEIHVIKFCMTNSKTFIDGHFEARLKCITITEYYFYYH